MIVIRIGSGVMDEGGSTAGDWCQQSEHAWDARRPNCGPSERSEWHDGNVAPDPAPRDVDVDPR